MTNQQPPSQNRIVFLNGKFVKERDAKISVFDHGFLYGDGVYETLRTYGGKIWQLAEHLKRLQKSARLLGLKIPSSLDQLGGFVAETVKRNGFLESRIRITLTRGVNAYDFTTCRTPTLCIQVQELKPEPKRVYEKGVAVVTFRGVRNLPEAKTISLLPLVLANRFLKKKRAYEALFVDERNYVLEGTITNVFMVKKGLIITPKIGMLSGKTRQFLLKIAKKNGFKILQKSIKIKDLYAADEIFITNAPRGIIPVVKIDGKKVGLGRPGIITQKLMRVFKAELKSFEIDKE